MAKRTITSTWHGQNLVAKDAYFTSRGRIIIATLCGRIWYADSALAKRLLRFWYRGRIISILRHTNTEFWTLWSHSVLNYMKISRLTKKTYIHSSTLLFWPSRLAPVRATQARRHWPTTTRALDLYLYIGLGLGDWKLPAYHVVNVCYVNVTVRTRAQKRWQTDTIFDHGNWLHGLQFPVKIELFT